MFGFIYLNWKLIPQVITLTEELLATAKQTELSALLGKANTAVPSYNGPYGEMHAFDMVSDELYLDVDAFDDATCIGFPAHTSYYLWC